jgi:hypothetical protein
MIFPHINLKKYFGRCLIRRPVYIGLLLIFLSGASIIAQKFEMIFIERLEKQTFKDKISTTVEAISYADFYGRNMWGEQVHKHHLCHSISDQALFVIVSPVENGNNETNLLVTFIKPDYTDLSEDVLDALPNKETELAGNLSLTPEEKLSLIALLNSLTDGYEPDRP